MEIKKEFLIAFTLLALIFLSGCTDMISYPKNEDQWYKGRCGNICPIGNCKTYVDIGNRTHWKCICVDTNWGETNVTKYCKVYDETNWENWVCASKEQLDEHYGGW